MMPGVDTPAMLLLLPLAVLPLIARMHRSASHPMTSLVPLEPVSRLLDLAIRGLGAVAITALVLGLAGLHRAGGEIGRTGLGANIVLLIDRSASMDNTFADRQPDGDEESKSAVAERLILDFVKRRPRDRVGVAAFSTSPIQVLPITDHLDAVRAALRSIDEPGLAQTNVGRGLALAFSMFGERTAEESCAVILVSDGASVVGPEVQEQLLDTVLREPVNLYWLFIRSKGSRGVFDVPAAGEQDTPQARPERHLHLFLQRLGIPYQVLEAESPRAIEDAIAEIDRLESKPITYFERVARLELAPFAYLIAAIAASGLVIAKLAERALVTREAELLAPLQLPVEPQ